MWRSRPTPNATLAWGDGAPARQSMAPEVGAPPDRIVRRGAQLQWGSNGPAGNAAPHAWSSPTPTEGSPLMARNLPIRHRFTPTPPWDRRERWTGSPSPAPTSQTHFYGSENLEDGRDVPEEPDPSIRKRAPDARGVWEKSHEGPPGLPKHKHGGRRAPPSSTAVHAARPSTLSGEETVPPPRATYAKARGGPTAQPPHTTTGAPILHRDGRPAAPPTSERTHASVEPRRPDTQPPQGGIRP